MEASEFVSHFFKAAFDARAAARTEELCVAYEAEKKVRDQVKAAEAAE